MGFDFGFVLVALAVLVGVSEWRYRRARRARAERLAGDPLFELEMQLEAQDKIVASLEGQRAREGVFASEGLVAEIERQHAELQRLRADYHALSKSQQPEQSNP